MRVFSYAIGLIEGNRLVPLNAELIAIVYNWPKAALNGMCTMPEKFSSLGTPLKIILCSLIFPLFPWVMCSLTVVL